MLLSAKRGKWIAPIDLEKKIAEIRALGKTIATLNGSFDLMHAGHLYILEEAREQADVLIVGLNTDRSIQKYKSPKRPIIPLEMRLNMMAALGVVDFVTWFDETDPRALLQKIRPDVHVNGEEYRKGCIEQAVVEGGGGKMHFVAKVPGLSTSEIIKKIVDVCG
jgi:D-glycero-beta-D-manno-heptose 1-phosphate adenylyltransferase